MPGSATLRMLQRSIRKPKTGTIIALKIPPNDSANEAWARSQPISAINGFRNTPKVKASTGPLQTKSPATAPTTTHHGFLKLTLTGVSPLFCRLILVRSQLAPPALDSWGHDYECKFQST